MIVCANGNVSDYCKSHDMIVAETHEGELLEYHGHPIILVTSKEMSEVEYCFTKMELKKRGVELVSTIHKDQENLVTYMKQRQKNGGRHKFGFQVIDGKAVLTERGRLIVKRIFELRDMGLTYRRISEDENVHHPDGRKLNISTIQIILKNRKIYEKEGL